MDQKNLISLTKTSAEIAAALILDEVNHINQNGVTISNETLRAIKKDTVIAAAEIVAETYKQLCTNLSDN